MFNWLGLPLETHGTAKYKNLLWLGLSLLVIFLDQSTKRWASDYLSTVDSINVMPGFDFSLAHNYGAAFSFLNQGIGWQTYFFILVAVALSVLLLFWLIRLPNEHQLTAFSLALILGGAWGNLIDRIWLGYVIDFIMLYYRQWYWPTFNLADSAICVGAAGLLWCSWREERHHKNSSK